MSSPLRTEVDSPQEIAADIAAVQRISAVPTLLRIVCDATGMGFAAVARVTDGTWTACAVEDRIGFGLKPGTQLDMETTLCAESRRTRAPIAVDRAGDHPLYCEHEARRLFQIESWMTVPIIQDGGRYFGNLCAMDRQPRPVANDATIAMFKAYADLVANQLAVEADHDETRAALDTARQTAELREQFVAMLSYDLRNPLATISANGALLAQHAADPEARSRGLRIKTSAQRMSRLVLHMLDFARVRLGSGLLMEKAGVHDLADALRQTTDEVRQAHPTRAISESISVDGPVYSDRSRIQQLAANLLDNAIEHGAPERPVDFKAWTAEGLLHVEVHNFGAPIPAHDQSRIFQPFRRSPHGRSGSGLSLGLFVSAQIAEAHGGTLTVDSAAGSGTRFAAVVPCG